MSIPSALPTPFPAPRTAHTVPTAAWPRSRACLRQSGNFQSPAEFVLNSLDTWGHGAAKEGHL